MARRTVLILLLAAAVLTAGFVYLQRRRAADAEWRAGIDATRIIDIAFDRTSELRVSQLHGTMLTRTEAAGCAGLCHGVQLTRAPVSVGYVIDLRHLPPSALRWNAADRVMFVELPDVTIDAPNIDMARAEVRQQGMWISRSMGQAMQSRAATNLAQKAQATAHDPANILRARAAAREAVRRLIAAPLAAAGLPSVSVKVRLAGDPVPDNRQWDVSRSIADVLADPRFKQ